MDNQFLENILSQRILSAVTINSTKKAVLVADVFRKAGLMTIEIPLRTPEALKCIYIIRKTFPEMHIGAGTILTAMQVNQSIDAGASFGLSPGFNPDVASVATKNNFPFIPGVMTPSDIELAYQSGFSILKIFPIQQIGGIDFLKALAGPYGHLDLKYIPMGGINNANLKSYIDHKSVIAAGGSWLANEQIIQAENYEQISLNIKKALTVMKSSTMKG